MTATLREGTQSRRLYDWLRANPGATAMELVTTLRIAKYTSRISDIRAAGHVIDCVKDPDGVDRYYVRTPPDWIDPETWMPRDMETALPCSCGHPKYHHHGKRMPCLYCACPGYAPVVVREAVAEPEQATLPW